MFYICTMNEVEDLLSWAKATRQSLDTVINKMEEKTFDDDDQEFLKKMYYSFEGGKFDA